MALYMHKAFNFLLSLVISAGMFSATASSRPEITSPKPGEAVLGLTPITGSVAVSAFQRAEVSFSYQEGADQTWFPIQQITEPVEDGTLAVWDTTTIADGLYQLRVQVWLEDGDMVETVVPNLRVRNYSAIETSTPAPTARSPAETPPSTAAPVRSALPSPTLLPANPAEVTSERMAFSITQGFVFAVILFLLFGFYLGLKGLFRR